MSFNAVDSSRYCPRPRRVFSQRPRRAAGAQLDWRKSVHLSQLKLSVPVVIMEMLSPGFYSSLFLYFSSSSSFRRTVSLRHVPSSRSFTSTIDRCLRQYQPRSRDSRQPASNPVSARDE